MKDVLKYLRGAGEGVWEPEKVVVTEPHLGSCGLESEPLHAHQREELEKLAFMRALARIEDALGKMVLFNEIRPENLTISVANDVKVVNMIKPWHKDKS